jgi:hypothetical protein
LLKIYKIRRLIDCNLFCIKKQRERVLERGKEREEWREGEEGEMEREREGKTKQEEEQL